MEQRIKIEFGAQTETLQQQNPKTVACRPPRERAESERALKRLLGKLAFREQSSWKAG